MLLLDAACASLLLSALFSAPMFATDRGQEIRLWPNGAPGSDGVTEAEQFLQPDTGKPPTRFTVVHYPSVYVYLPPKDRATGVAVVVAPGGGHQSLVIDKEGWDIAGWLNGNGIAAFVLKYRLARSPGSHYTVVDHALPDALRAMRLVRSRAGEWGVNPSRIGFMGFSAGGEVAALAETRFDTGNDSAADPIDRLSSRPDFAVVVYPGFRPDLISVPKNAPPTFLVCADNDRSHVVTTVNLYLALEKQGISSELHVYASGGHGFGMRDVHAPVSTWNARLMEWLADRGLLQNQ